MSAGDVTRAGTLLEQALAPYFPDEDPPRLRRLGSEVFAAIARRVRAKGLAPDLAADIFQEALVDALRHLSRHDGGGVYDLRGWVHTLARHAVYRQLKALFGDQRHPHPVVVSLEGLLEGEGEYALPAPPPVLQTDEDLERILVAAISRLQGRHRQLAERHFLRQESAAEIKRSMALPSDRSLARLYRQTVRFLVTVVKELLAHTIAANWVA